MNTNREGMAQRCPGALSLGHARLIDHAFRFAIHADVVPVLGSYVDGVLWRIDEFSKTGQLNEIHENYELSNYFVRDGQIEDLSHYQLIDGIYKRNVIYPFPKHIEKYAEGYVYKSPLCLV